MKIFIYTPHLPAGECQQISFMDMLLDETLSYGRLEYPDAIYAEIGDINQKLHANQQWEFLLRAASKCTVYRVGQLELECFGGGKNDGDECDLKKFNDDPWEKFRTDCYVTAKYQDELKEAGIFSDVLDTLAATIETFFNPDVALSLLTNMIQKSSEYYRIDDNTRPILIYKGEADFCCNVLNSFSEQLGKALLSLHQRVIFFDASNKESNELIPFIGQHLKAVIGIQTGVFLVQINGIYLHNLIHAPKFDMLLDNPLFIENISNLLDAGLTDFYPLFHDRNYISFVNTYYTPTAQCFHFCPAGVLPAIEDNIPQKKYDITFVGSYRNYRTHLLQLMQYERSIRFFLVHYLNIMKKEPNLTIEAAFDKTLAYDGITLTDKDFASFLFECRISCCCINDYYREKTVLALLSAGIEIHVYGNSWDDAPFASHPQLVRHPGLMFEESIEVMQHSKLSLNLMTFHKDGFTERIANIMLCHSVLLSEKSTYLEENFKDGEEVILFDVNKLDSFVQRVKYLLQNDFWREQIANRGFEKAKAHHQWINRAEQFLNIIDSL